MKWTYGRVVGVGLVSFLGNTTTYNSHYIFLTLLIAGILASLLGVGNYTRVVLLYLILT